MAKQINARFAYAVGGFHFCRLLKITVTLIMTLSYLPAAHAQTTHSGEIRPNKVGAAIGDSNFGVHSNHSQKRQSSPHICELVSKWTSEAVKDVFVSGRYVFTISDAGQLLVFDVVDPLGPALVGRRTLPPLTSEGIYVSGNYAYTVGLGLVIIDISDPRNPTIVGSSTAPDQARAVYVKDNHAYIANGEAGLQVIDISNPQKPSLVGSVDTQGLAYSVYVSGHYAYVGHWAGGLQIINLSSPQNPVPVGIYAPTQFYFDVHVSGNYAYAVDGQSLDIINVANPQSPALAGRYSGMGLGGNPFSVHVSGNYAFVSPLGAGLAIIDVSNPSSPTLVGQCDRSGDVYVSGNYIYVASGGLFIFRHLHPPSVPILLFPADNATVSRTPTFQLSATDPDGNRLKFKIELLQSGQVVKTFDQTKDATGWDKADYGGDETATFTLPQSQALTEGTYRWRAFAYDGKVWSDASATQTFVATVGGLPTQLAAGDRVVVTDKVGSQGLRVREQPGLDGKVTATFPQGTEGNVLEGPQQKDSYVWWKVTYRRSANEFVTGWSAESRQGDGYYLERTKGYVEPRLDLKAGARVRITQVGDNLTVREEAGRVARALGQVQVGTEGEVLEGPVEENGFIWWKIKFTSANLTGWCAESDKWYGYFLTNDSLTLTVRPERLEYLPSQEVVFTGSVKTSSGQPMPNVRVNVEDPLIKASMLGPLTDASGNFRYTTDAPQTAEGVYAFAFLVAPSSRAYSMINVKISSGLALTDNSRQIRLGATSNLSDIDLALSAKLGFSNSTVPTASSGELLDTVTAITTFMADASEQALIDFISNPANRTAFLISVGCLVGSWNGIGTLPCSAIYLWTLQENAKSVTFGALTQAIERSNLTPDQKAFWKDVVKPGVECAIGIIFIDPKYSAVDPRDVLDATGTGWSCGEAVAGIVKHGSRQILKINALPSSGSQNKAAMGAIIIPLGSADTPPVISNPNLSRTTFGNKGGKVTISTTITDDKGVASAWALINGATRVALKGRGSAYSTRWKAPKNNGTTAQTYAITLFARDTAGNQTGPVMGGTVTVEGKGNKGKDGKGKKGRKGRKRQGALEDDNAAPVSKIGANAGAARVFMFTLNRPARVEARLLTPTGKLVRRFEGRMARAGLNSFVWEGKTQSGATAPRGVYLLQLIAADEEGGAAQAVGTVVVR